MARRVFLHIGPPKTGTSFLQAAWFQHREDLARQGLLYPGRHLMSQFRASAVALDKGPVVARMPAGQRGRPTADPAVPGHTGSNPAPPDTAIARASLLFSSAIGVRRFPSRTFS